MVNDDANNDPASQLPEKVKAALALTFTIEDPTLTEVPLADVLSAKMRKQYIPIVSRIEEDTAAMETLKQYVVDTQTNANPDPELMIDHLQRILNKEKPEHIRVTIPPATREHYGQLLEKVTKDTLALQKPLRGDISIV